MELHQDSSYESWAPHGKLSISIFIDIDGFADDGSNITGVYKRNYQDLGTDMKILLEKNNTI